MGGNSLRTGQTFMGTNEVPPEGLHLPQGFVPPESWKQDPKTLGWAEQLSDSSESESEGLEEYE